MKAGNLINLFMSYDESDEVEIEIYDSLSDQYIDTTAAISVVADGVFVPALRIDAEAGKLRDIP